MARTAMTRFNLFLRILYFTSLSVYAYFLLQGLPFYLIPRPERIHHDAYRLWRSAGDIGHAFGIIGGLMMTIMLLYSVRKRFHLFHGLGPVNYWLKIHIYFGIIGPLLVILHTTFKVQGLVAVCFWSMLAVALSGVLGRYLYLQIPRTLLGNELNLKQAQNLEDEFRAKLDTDYGLRPSSVTEIYNVIDPGLSMRAGSLSALFRILLQDLLRPFKLRRLEKLVTKEASIVKEQRRDVIKLVKRQALLHRRILLWNHTHSLFHYWHVIHQPFAYIMYLTLLVHVGVSVWLGYTWIF